MIKLQYSIVLSRTGFVNLVLILLWWRWTWSLRFCDEGLRSFSENTALKMIYFVNTQYLLFWLCWKNSLNFCDCKDVFSLQLLDPFIDLICLQLLQGKELQILFLLKLVYIYFFPYLTWIVISLFLSFIGLDCNFFISFLVWLGLLLFDFFPSLTWIATFLFLSFFIYFHICFLLFLLYNSALFLLCLNTFSSSPQSLVIVQVICSHENPVHLIEHT